jgi:DNA modification methylase
MIKLKKIEQAIVEDKLSGMSDIEIGKKYKITYRQLEDILRKATGVSISSLKKEKEVKKLAPKDFKEETTTVWSFKSRGDWATHSGEYRGNWSPYIPRNVILKYSKPGELVLDYFCGAGTTAVEAKLLGRRCIALDINDRAIELARENIDFKIPGHESLIIYEPELFVGDARDLSFLKDNSVDLICAHPPYADIIHYTNHKEGDLSFLGINDFLKEMKKVAHESFRVLKPGRQCAILIGDMRRHKHVVPLGFKLINVYLDAGFKLKELVIKRQHNCKTTGFWYKNSIKYNFLLLAHEYLPIFEKPIDLHESVYIGETLELYKEIATLAKKPQIGKLKEFETTTVWIFPEDKLKTNVDGNVIKRYAPKGQYKLIELSIKDVDNEYDHSVLIQGNKKNMELLFLKSSCLEQDEFEYRFIKRYLEYVTQIIKNTSCLVQKNGYIVIQTKDVRINGYVEPMAKYIVDSLDGMADLSLKEIVVVSKENCKIQNKLTDDLEIIHNYLLIYKKLGG